MKLSSFFTRCMSTPSVPVAIQGPPGCGKTAQVEAFARTHHLPLVKLLASTLDETDVAGIVVRDGDNAKTLSPSWFNKLKSGRGILFLDEFNCARREVLDTLLTLVCSRHLPNGDRLGDGVLIIAAMNPTTLCDNTELSPAMRTRFIWVDYELSMADWASWALTTEREDSVEPLSESYVTYDEWVRWFRSADGNDADKKAYLKDAIDLGLAFEEGADIVSNALPTTPRGLMNLMYWCRFGTEMGRLAGFFVSDKAVAVLQSVRAKAVNTVCNRIWDEKGRFEHEDETDAKEAKKTRNKKAFLDRVEECAKGADDVK